MRKRKEQGENLKNPSRIEKCLKCHLPCKPIVYITALRLPVCKECWDKIAKSKLEWNEKDSAKLIRKFHYSKFMRK